MASISGLTFNDIASSMGKASASVETSLRNKITSIQNSENVTSADMLSLQADMQQWTMMTQIQSTVVKELGDTMKGVIQKAA